MALCQEKYWNTYFIYMSCEMCYKTFEFMRYNSLKSCEFRRSEKKKQKKENIFISITFINFLILKKLRIIMKRIF